MAKRVLLKDIAQKVGVSTALVSYVMNGLEKEKRVGANIVKRIKEVAQELDYKPNQIAQSLRRGSTQTLGVILADISNPFFGHMARVIEDEAGKLGYTVIFGSSDEDAVKSDKLIQTFSDRQVDGFIIVPAENSASQIKKLFETGKPLVQIDRCYKDVETNFVGLDNFNASFHAVKALIMNGRKRIAMVAYHSSLSHMEERIAGYKEAMVSYGLESNIRIVELDYAGYLEETDRYMQELINVEEPADGLFFATNSISLVGLYWIKRNKIRVPEDVAIIGFDGNEAFDFFYAPLSYVEQPIVEMGKEAVRLIVEQIKGNSRLSQIRLKENLVLRESCC